MERFGINSTRYLKACVSLILVLVVGLPCLPVSAQQTTPAVAEAGFADTAGHWAENAILYCDRQGLVNVYADGTVRPDQPITRAEFSYSMGRWMADNWELLDSLGVVFQPYNYTILMDVPMTHVYYSEISAVFGRSLISADGALFRPNDNMTRQELCESWTAMFMTLTTSQMDAKYFSSLSTDTVLGRFIDQDRIRNTSKIANSRQAVAVMIDRGFMSGYQDYTFRPGNIVTRAEAFSALASIDNNLRYYGDYGSMQYEMGDQSRNETGDVRVIRMQPKNYHSSGFDLEVTVSGGAVKANAELVLSSTNIADTRYNAWDVENSRISTGALKLAYMDKVIEHPYQTTYTIPLKYDFTQPYTLYSMLKTDKTTSAVERVEVTYPYSNTGAPLMPTGSGGYAAGGTYSYGRLLNLSVSDIGTSRVRLEIGVNEAAVSDDTEVYISYTTNKSLIVDETSIGTNRDGLLSMSTSLHGMREVKANNWQHVYSTDIAMPSLGTYYFHVMIRSGGRNSVILNGSVTLGSQELQTVMDVRSDYNFIANIRETIYGRYQFELRLQINHTAVNKNADVIIAFTQDDTISITTSNIFNFPGKVFTSQRPLSYMTLTPSQYTSGSSYNSYWTYCEVPSAGTWHIYVFLRSGNEVSNLLSRWYNRIPY